MLAEIFLVARKDLRVERRAKIALGQVAPLALLILIVFAFGWIDTLWIFGVEDSKHYTWWYVIQQMGEYFG